MEARMKAITQDGLNTEVQSLSKKDLNKKCFECALAGTTYVNLTIGSFVCTSCSGLLRGLNPPHRLKSLSMSNFTKSDIAFLSARGNQYCRQTWLGKFKVSFYYRRIAEDRVKLKEFLKKKYEDKEWYISEPVEEITKTISSSQPAPLSIRQPSSEEIHKEDVSEGLTQNWAKNLFDAEDSSKEPKNTLKLSAELLTSSQTFQPQWMLPSFPQQPPMSAPKLHTMPQRPAHCIPQPTNPFNPFISHSSSQPIISKQSVNIDKETVNLFDPLK